MFKRILWSILVIIIVIILYFLLWPVPIDPVAWEAPPNPGYSGSFAVNERLKGIETFSIAGNHGPEDIAVDAQGRIYTTSHEGRIVRLSADCSGPQNWVDTKGRPLGIDFDGNGKVVANLQDPDGSYPINTGVTETKDYIYVGSLVAPALGRLKKEKIGL